MVQCIVFPNLKSSSNLTVINVFEVTVWTNVMIKLRCSLSHWLPLNYNITFFFLNQFLKQLSLAFENDYYASIYMVVSQLNRNYSIAKK